MMDTQRRAVNIGVAVGGPEKEEDIEVCNTDGVNGISRWGRG